MKKYSTVLTIAGSDSSGGAGIQADLKTFAALRCYGISVITAVTAQSTRGITGIHVVPPRFVEQQLTTVLKDIPIAAAKIGMLATAKTIETVAQVLREYRIPIILDPLLSASDGKSLLAFSALSALTQELLPLATVVTPNIPEAEQLTGKKIRTYRDIEETAETIVEMGAHAVLLKGGHLGDTEACDFLVLKKTKKNLYERYWFKEKKIVTKNTHGTGCTLSAALAAYIARGYPLMKAVESAKTYVTDALRGGKNYVLGKGYGPLHHFYNYWK